MHCHCESCRRQTSSPVATFVIVPKAALRFTSGQPKEFASSPGVRRSFCGECGSPISYRTDGVRMSSISTPARSSDPSALAPQCHVHAVEQLPWFEVLDDLPRYPGSRWGDGPCATGRAPIFLALLLPGMFISAIGSTVLGIALLRGRYTPRLTPWLLTLAFPSMLIIPTVLGHNSLGMVPLILAWGISGIQLWRAHDQASPGEIAPQLLPGHGRPA